MHNYNKCERILLAHWQKAKPWGWFLWPFSIGFRVVASLRKTLYQRVAYRSTVPIIIVGNITVGGAGKTPTVIYLAQLLKNNGYKPGIVTRGYKGSATTPVYVNQDTQPSIVGDEALLLAKRTNCPVIVAKQRVLGIKLIENCVDVIICDDGLQHYKLARDIEIVVVDATRRFGNGYCLPMGPLREHPKRLTKVDLVVTNGADMQLVPNLELNGAGQTIHAVAGIGDPQRFFTMLTKSGFNVIPHAFPDHHAYRAQDLEFADPYPIYMTEKDAVKCEAFNKVFVAVGVDVHMTTDFDQKILTMLKERHHVKSKLA